MEATVRSAFACSWLGSSQRQGEAQHVLSFLRLLNPEQDHSALKVFAGRQEMGCDLSSTSQRSPIRGAFQHVAVQAGNVVKFRIVSTGTRMDIGWLRFTRIR